MRLSARCPTAKISRFDVGDGVSLQLAQFFFDSASPVPQPVGSRRDADGTGLKVWPTAAPLLTTLQRLVADRFHHLTRPLRVLELGSGCGLIGLGLAATRRAHVVMTDPCVAVNFSEEGDGSDTLDWLRSNVELNRGVLERGCGGSVRVEKLRWGDESAALALRGHAGFDLVVGSDLLYEPDSYPKLLASLHHLAGSSAEAAAAGSSLPVAVLGYPVRHGGEHRFWRALNEGGVLVAGETRPVSEAQLDHSSSASPAAVVRASATFVHLAVANAPSDV